MEDSTIRNFRIVQQEGEEKLNAFLSFTGREILENAGTISKKIADSRAKEQFIRYEEHRRVSEREKIIDVLPDFE